MRIAQLPDSCAATTINKVCGSGMKATMLAMDLIKAGSADTVVAGGMESMSNAPYLVAKARTGLRMGHAGMLDSLFTDGLEDAETGGSMGSFAQNTADEHQLTREAMDAYAIESVNAHEQRLKTNPWHLKLQRLKSKAQWLKTTSSLAKPRSIKFPTYALPSKPTAPLLQQTLLPYLMALQHLY